MKSFRWAFLLSQLFAYLFVGANTTAAAIITRVINLDEEGKSTQAVDFNVVPGFLIMCEFTVNVNSDGINDGCRRSGVGAVKDPLTISDIVAFGFGDAQTA